MVLIHDSKHQSVTKPTTILPFVFSYTYQNHLHVLTHFDANYCIILIVILTHSHSPYPVLYAHFFHILHYFSRYTFNMDSFIYFLLCNSLLEDCYFHLLVALLISATGEPTSEQDTIKDMKHM